MTRECRKRHFVKFKFKCLVGSVWCWDTTYHVRTFARSLGVFGHAYMLQCTVHRILWRKKGCCSLWSKRWAVGTNGSRQARATRVALASVRGTHSSHARCTQLASQLGTILHSLALAPRATATGRGAPAAHGALLALDSASGSLVYPNQPRGQPG